MSLRKLVELYQFVWMFESHAQQRMAWEDAAQGRLYGYSSESYNFNTRLLEVAANPALHAIVGETAYDAASYLVPIDPDARNRWIDQGIPTPFALYNKITAL